jgi:hypothetical protein
MFFLAMEVEVLIQPLNSKKIALRFIEFYYGKIPPQ